jgi:hypothetical protein
MQKVACFVFVFKVVFLIYELGWMTRYQPGSNSVACFSNMAGSCA